MLIEALRAGLDAGVPLVARLRLASEIYGIR